jgi:hypothetical protein
MPVMPKRCDECLFSTRKIVSDPAKEDVLAECRQSGRAFVCHKASFLNEYRVCRGFFDRDESIVVILAKKLGRVKFVPLPPEQSDNVLSVPAHPESGQQGRAR